MVSLFRHVSTRVPLVHAATPVPCRSATTRVLACFCHYHTRTAAVLGVYVCLVALALITLAE